MAAPSDDPSRPPLPATLVELAGHRLRDAILSGELAPGDKIVEEQLCADFGISRAPLREALRLLAQQGLVEHLPRRGSRVTEWSPAGHPATVRAAARPGAARHRDRAAACPTPGTRSSRSARRWSGWTPRQDDLERDDAHRAFHAAVVGLAANRQLDITLEPILLKLQLPMAMNLREEARQRETGDGIERHKAILSALETNDPAVVRGGPAGPRPSALPRAGVRTCSRLKSER